MSRLAKLAGEQAHQRKIDVSTSRVDDTHILTHGRLTDERLMHYFKFTGEKVDAGTLHDLEIYLLIKIPDLIIEDIEVVIGTVPRGDCLKVEQTLEPVKGMAIMGGFSAKVKQAAGGKQGCTHLVHLLCTMAPAVMQGVWALSYQKKPERGDKNSKRAEKMGRMMKDSCYAWREEGDAYQKMLKLIEENKSQE